MNKLIVVVAATLLVACTASVSSGGRTVGATASTSISTPSSAKSQTSMSTTKSTSSVVARTTAPSTPSQSSSATASNTLDACAHFTGHVFEVCTAYIANSSLAVLVPYYKYAKSPDATLARYVTYRLGSRYSDQAYKLISSRVASWPAGIQEVGVPTITILSVHSNLQTNIATLVTQESWQVTTQGGAVVYREDGRQHTVTMHRVPSYVLHKWVVTNIQ